MAEPSAQPRRDSLRQRFPALARLERAKAGKRRVPFVMQSSHADCGAACLLMTLRYHGGNARLDPVRDRLGVGRDGTSAQQIIEAARTFGLRGRAIRIEPGDLRYLAPGSILHWRMNHFVVFEHIGRGGAAIVDPGIGRRTIHPEELAKSFTGIAIELERTADFARGDKSDSLVKGYVRRVLVHSRLLTRVIVLSAFVQVLGLALPLLTGALVDRVIPYRNVDLLVTVAAVIVAIGLFGFFASYVRALLMLHLRTNLDVEMTIDFLEHMMRLPLSFFHIRQSGDLVMRLNSNATIRETLTNAALSALLDGFLVCSYLAVLLVVHARLGMCVIALGLLRVLIYVTTRRRHRELMAEHLEAQAQSSNYQVQMLTGIESLKSAGAESQAVRHWSNLFVDVMNVSVQRGRLNALVQSSLDVLGMISPLILIGYGASLVIAGDLTLGTMLAMSALGVGFLAPLTPLVNTALSLQALGGYIDRVEDIVIRAPEQPTGRPPAPPLQGEIELDRVSFRYSEFAPLVVRNVSVRIEKGALVAIVGSSGSGKSTLARLMVGLLSPESGDIRFDGEAMTRYDLQSFRRQFGFVPQSPYLFGWSIRDNIAVAHPEIGLDEVERAARLACIHDEIADMPLRYETGVSVAGASLSGGQRQRIALARALVGRPPIVVLDETTSHLDAVTEARVHRSLSELHCTRVLIAHRLSTVVDADLILVMQEGRVVERGNHAELVAQGGAYAELIASQLRAK